MLSRRTDLWMHLSNIVGKTGRIVVYYTKVVTHVEQYRIIAEKFLLVERDLLHSNQRTFFSCIYIKTLGYLLFISLRENLTHLKLKIVNRVRGT